MLMPMHLILLIIAWLLHALIAMMAVRVVLTVPVIVEETGSLIIVANVMAIINRV